MGVVPKMMKMANVVPLFKTGDRSCTNNYRPVSLTPIIAKIFEKLINDKMIAHLNHQNVIHPAQHGFLKDHSTNTNLIHFWNDVTKLADKKKEVSIVYTDLKKAFDSVPHDLLIYKLDNYGVRGRTLKWIESFLTDRVQRVIVNDKTSHLASIESGVPQGGVLSGILFDPNINDLPSCLNFMQISMYADDAKLFSPVDDKK